MKTYLTAALFIFVLLTANITKVIHITESIRFNMALSDSAIVFVLLVVFIAAIRDKSIKTIKGFPVWVALASWIIFSGALAMRSSDIINEGWIGIAEELAKTGLCVVYFIVGYHTLKAIKTSTFKSVWVAAAFVFILGGIVINYLAIKDIYYWSEDTKYLRYFMGTDTDPNHAATYLTLTFFAMGLFAMGEKMKANKALFIFTLALSVFGIVLTGSRGGLIGFVGGLGILFLYYIKKNWRLSVTLVSLILLMSLVFVQVDMQVFEGQFSQRILSKLDNFEGGLDIRWSLGYTALQMGHDHPITGVGRGNYILNSAPYFEEHDLKFFDDIPHNTYWGLYAEVGVIGLILFFAPSIMLLYAAYKRYKGSRQRLADEWEGLIWLIAGGVALGVQAFVLNVENRRFLWYLAGVLIFLFESQTDFFKLTHAHGRQLWRKFSIISVLASVIVYGYVASDASVAVRSTVVEGDALVRHVYAVPMQSVALGQNNHIGIHLTLGVNPERTERLLVTVSQTNKDGMTTVLSANRYKGVRGQLFLDFKPSMDAESINLVLSSLDPTLERYVFRPLSLIINDDVHALDKWYFLQPPVMRDALSANKKISLSNYLPETDLSTGLGGVFAEHFEVEAVTHRLIDVTAEDGTALKQTHIDVTYKVLQAVDEDYTLVFLGYPFDLAPMHENLIINGYEGYGLLEPVETHKWQAGERYTVTYVMPRQDGNYRLLNGIRIKKDDKWIHLYAHEGTAKRSVYLEIGTLDLGKVSLIK